MKTTKAIIIVLLVLFITAMLSSCSNKMYRGYEENYDDVYMNSEDIESEKVRTEYVESKTVRKKTYKQSKPTSQNRTLISTEYRAGTPKLVEVKTGETKRVK